MGLISAFCLLLLIHTSHSQNEIVDGFLLSKIRKGVFK